MSTSHDCRKNLVTRLKLNGKKVKICLVCRREIPDIEESTTCLYCFKPIQEGKSIDNNFCSMECSDKNFKKLLVYIKEKEL